MHRARSSRLIKLLDNKPILLFGGLGIRSGYSSLKMLYQRLYPALASTVYCPSFGILPDSLLC